MSAANQEREDGFEKLLDELTGPAPEDDSDEFEDPESDPEPLAAESEHEEGSEPEKDEDDDEEEPGNLRLEATPPKEAEPEVESEADTSDAEKRLAEQEKRNAGLEAELRKLRAERRQNALQASRQDAPPPTREFVPTHPTVPTQPMADDHRIPVVVSEDGQSVYVDDAKLQARAAEIARREYAEASKPTPEQLRAYETQRLAQSFIGSDPETQADRQAIFVAAQKADDYISMKITGEAERQGFRPRNIEDVQMFMHQTGIVGEVEQYFPEIAPMVDEFVAAYASDNTVWKRSVLDRIAALSESPSSTPSGGSNGVRKLSGSPESLSRKGGTRSISPNSDQAEFEKLERSFRADPIKFPDDKYERYQSLGKKLEMDGFD